MVLELSHIAGRVVSRMEGFPGEPGFSACLFLKRNEEILCQKRFAASLRRRKPEGHYLERSRDLP